MPDGALVEASKQLIDVGMVGTMLVFVLAAFAWVVRQWMKTLQELYAEKDARLRDVKETAALSESLRNAMAANTAAIQTMLGLLK